MEGVAPVSTGYDIEFQFIRIIFFKVYAIQSELFLKIKRKVKVANDYYVKSGI